MAESESSELLDVSPYEGGNMLNSEVFRTRDIRWISANLDMREGKAFGHRPSLEQGPCRFGFHVPTTEEREAVSDIVDDLELTEFIHEALCLPKAGKKTGLNTDVDVGDEGYYHTRIPNSNGTANVFHPSSEGSEMLQLAIKNAISVRGFRNAPVVPTRAWTRYAPGNHPILPSEYQEVEYIQNSGTQRINTGVFAGNNIQVETKVEVVTTTQELPVFGCYGANDVHPYYHLTCYQSQWCFGINGSESHGGTYNATIGTQYKIVYNNVSSKLNVNDSDVADTTGTTGYTGTTLGIGVRGNGQYCGQYKYFYFKMYDKTNGVYIRNLVPCFRKSDGEPGMYDLVTNTFYTNAGTGRFLMGRDVGYLPQEYEQVEYLLNTTGEEYINTGITSSSSFVASFLMTPTLIDSEKGFIGAAWTSEDNLLTYYSGKFRWHNGGNYVDTVSVSANTQYDIWIDTTGITINGGKYNVAAGSTYSGNEIWFFRSNGQTNLSYSPRVKYYGLRMWKQGNFVRDFVPCMRKSDGVLGFYDLVNEEFYTNQGNGAFVRGRILSAYKVNENTMSYFPLCDEKDVTGNRTLTLGNVTFSDSYANINAASSYLLPNVAFGGSIITVSLFYYCQSLNSNSWNTLLCRNPGTYHHLLISGGNSDEATAGRVGFWNNSWYGGNKVITPGSRYHFVMTKNGTNEKIYVNGELILDSNNSWDNNTYQLSIFGGHTNSSGNQGSIGKMSEFIVEQRERTQEEVTAYLNTMKDYFGIVV